MASPRAWPRSMLEDSDVLRLDPSGRFVTCRVCCLEYAVYGDQEPERVDMGLPFFTHEWSKHKRLRHAELTMMDDQRVSNEAAQVVSAEPLSLVERTLIKQEARPALRSTYAPSTPTQSVISVVTSGSESDCASEIMSAQDDAASSRKRPAGDMEDNRTQRPAPESPATRRRTALYYRTLRAVYTADPSETGSSSSRLVAAHGRSGGALIDLKRLTLALGVDCCTANHQIASRGLVNVIDELTRALARGEHETQAADGSDTRVLAKATAALVALRRDQQRVVAQMMQLQERNLEQLRALIETPPRRLSGPPK